MYIVCRFYFADMQMNPTSEPAFYLDNLPDLPGTDRRELIRSIEIKAEELHIYTWINQLRVAPYSYDFLDNRRKKSPYFIIENLPPLKINAHFLLAFHVYAFENNSFIVGRFCEPINAPVNRYIKGLYIEYRLLKKTDSCQLWCKVLGFVNRDVSSKMFFLIFSVINKIMMSRQLKTIMKLSEKMVSHNIGKKQYDFRDHYPQSGWHWWLFCRRSQCKGLMIE